MITDKLKIGRSGRGIASFGSVNIQKVFYVPEQISNDVTVEYDQQYKLRFTIFYHNILNLILFLSKYIVKNFYCYIVIFFELNSN